MLINGCVPWQGLGRLSTVQVITLLVVLEGKAVERVADKLAHVVPVGLSHVGAPFPILGVALSERSVGGYAHPHGAVVPGEGLAVFGPPRVAHLLLGLQGLGGGVGAVVAVIGAGALLAHDLANRNHDPRRRRQRLNPAHSLKPSDWLRCLLKAPFSCG